MICTRPSALLTHSLAKQVKHTTGAVSSASLRSAAMYFMPRYQQTSFCLSHSNERITNLYLVPRERKRESTAHLGAH